MASEATIFIVIEDVNDEIPLFTEREQERVLEGEPIGKVFQKVPKWLLNLIVAIWPENSFSLLLTHFRATMTEFSKSNKLLVLYVILLVVNNYIVTF